MADLYDGFDDGEGDPGEGRDSGKFYAFDAKSHADAINTHTAVIDANTADIEANAEAIAAIIAGKAGTDSTDKSVVGTTFVAPGTTDKVTIDVPNSGKVLVILVSTLTDSGASTGYVGYALSGTNTRAASERVLTAAGSSAGTYSAFRVETGLIPGSTTFQLNYATAQFTRHFGSSTIVVIPLG